MGTAYTFLIEGAQQSLDRGSGTLSGGESQRIRLASQIGSGLTGVLYVLDEPSIGLHQRDNSRLLETLRRLRVRNFGERREGFHHRGTENAEPRSVRLSSRRLGRDVS